MKIHSKKKAYRLYCKEQAKAGKMNTADGVWASRNSFKDDSMRRDYNSGQQS